MEKSKSIFSSLKNKIGSLETELNGKSTPTIIIIVSILVIASVVLAIYFVQFYETPTKVIDKEGLICTSANKLEQDWCYLEKTKSTKINYCDNIESVDLKLYCRSSYDVDPTLCQEINKILVRDGCFISIAEETLDVDICERTSKKAFCIKTVSEAVKKLAEADLN